MSDDFDIYADLEHMEREAEKESHEIVALKEQIKELQKQVKATEQEKADIIRRNETLLENVSSLLLTAKAEIKRKDTMISDLRRQCDNVAFGRKAHVDQSGSYRTKFTQTPVTYTINIGVQTLPGGCNDPSRSKSKDIDVVTDSIQHRDRDRERERVCKSQILPEREHSHGRDRSGTRGIARHRDQERTRDRDRYRDSDRERDRERYSARDRERNSEQYRKQSQDRKHHKEHHSYDRSGDTETHDVTRRKDLRHNEGRTRNDDEKHAPLHSRANEADEFDKNKPRHSDNKQKCLEIRSEIRKAHRRTQELKDSKKPDKVTNTDSNHASKHVAQKHIASKLGEFDSDTSERPATKRAINEHDHVANESCSQTTSLVDTNITELGIQMSSEVTKQHLVDACTSIPQNDRRTDAVSCSKSSDNDVQKENTKKREVKEMGKPKDSSRGDQKYIPQAQDNHKKVNVNTHQLRTPHSTETDPIQTTSSKSYESFSKDHQLNTTGEKLDVSESVRDASTSEKGNEETNCTKEHDTFLPGNEAVSSSILNHPVSSNEASSYSVEFSSQDTRSILVDKIHNEEEVGSSKGIHPSIEVRDVQSNTINELQKKIHKGKTSSKRKARPEPATTVFPNDASKDLKQNEPCQTTPANDEQIRTTSSSKNEVQNADPCQLSTFRTTHNTKHEGDASQTKQKTQELTCSEATINVETTAGNKADHNLMRGTMEPNTKLPLVNVTTKKIISDGPTIAVVNETVNEKQQNQSPIHDAISSHDSNSQCFALRDRRSNSCYSDVLELGKHPPEHPSETMSIQAYFMNFNVQEVENEVISGIEPPARCVETGNENGSVVLNLATDFLVVKEATDMQPDAINEVQKKPKTSTAEIVRERLRKKNSTTLQRVSHHSAISMPVVPLKRRLSIDSASMANKRYKLDTETTVDGNMLTVSPSGKLSSTYFSQIALPITSALDSIPSKLKSPNIKQKARDMLMTPMVVVHSPAKPSQEMDKNVQINYYSLPMDDQSSLQTIMDSLLQTPIKNESSDSVSPPCANGLAVDEGKGQNCASKSYEKLEICPTPLSTKPLSRFSLDDGPTNPLFRKSTSVAQEQNLIQTFSERKDPLIPLTVGNRPKGNASSIDGKEKDVQEQPSKQATYVLGKHGDGAFASTVKRSRHRKGSQSPKPMLNQPSANGDSSCLNGNNIYKPSSTKKTAKKMSAVPDIGESTKNDTAIIQHPSNTSNSIVSKKTVAVPESTHLKQQTTKNTANNNDTSKVEDKNFKLGEKLSSKKAHHKSTANVDAVEKTGKRTITQSSSKCTGEESSHLTTPPIDNSSHTVSSETSTELPTHRTTVSLKRSRKQKHDNEKRPGLTEMQSVEKLLAPIKSGSKTLHNYENKQPVGCNYTAVGNVNPQQNLGEARLTASLTSVHLKRLNPQTPTEPSVPVNVVSATNTRDKRTEQAARSQCVVSNVTLNLSLADNASNNRSIRRHDTPVQHVREMRIVKESPSLMRVFITRK